MNISLSNISFSGRGGGGGASVDIIDNLNSTRTNAALSANQGRVLNEGLTAVKAIGRFLSVWNCSTGQPDSFPLTVPYTYKTGDYFVVGTVNSSGTNYKPNGSTYDGSASTTVDTEDVKINDMYFYDGTTWLWLVNSRGISEVTFSSILGQPSDNANLATALNAKEATSNKVTSLSASSTDVQYPSAKVVYDTTLPIAYMQGQTVVTSVVDVPTTKRLVSINASSDGSLNLANVPANGAELHVIITNTGTDTITIAMPSSSPYITATECIAIDAGERGEVSFISDGTNIYVRAIGTVTRNYSPIGKTNVTSLANIPIANELVLADVSANGSITLAEVPVAGKDVHVIIHNTGSSSIDVTLPTTSPYILTSGENPATIAANGYAEVNFVSDGTNIYVRCA